MSLKASLIIALISTAVSGFALADEFPSIENRGVAALSAGPGYWTAERRKAAKERVLFKDSEISAQVAGSANLDWKFGSATMVDFYRRNFHRGVWLEEVTQTPRILPSKGPWLYYAVKRDNEAWQYVHKEQSLAMRLNTHLIRNLDSLQGKRDLVVSVRGQSVILQFALFAVAPFK